MTPKGDGQLEVMPMWSMINDELVELLGLIPDGKLDWSPAPERWNFKGILIHMVFGRYGLTGIAKDGGEAPNILQAGQTRDGLRELLSASWQRIEACVADAEALAREYDAPFYGKTQRLSGHWLAFGLLEHDIHHRAEILSYLDALGIAHEEPDTVARRFREG